MDDVCQPYLDDSSVHSKTFEDHLRDLRKVLHRYQQHVIKLTAKKCEVFKSQVQFLGKLVSKDGYTTDPIDIALVQAFRERKPATVGDLRKLLGLISYYCPYIPNFSWIAKPLSDLLSMDKTTASGRQSQKERTKLEKRANN